MICSLAAWLEEFSKKLTSAFGQQLLYLGIQGSYGRGEAGPDSDIDLVVILKQVELEQLKAYRALLDTMPHQELACGFLCGKAELEAWPAYDLLQLQLDTKPILGSLDGLLPPLDHDVLTQAITIGASNLYHGACHSFLYSSNNLEQLRTLYKYAFFLLRLVHFAQGNSYVAAGRDLLPRLVGTDQEILTLSLHRDAFAPDQAAELYEKLISWSSQILRTPLL